MTSPQYQIIQFDSRDPSAGWIIDASGSMDYEEASEPICAWLEENALPFSYRRGFSFWYVTSVSFTDPEMHLLATIRWGTA